jgi:hypothetical protein
MFSLSSCARVGGGEQVPFYDESLQMAEDNVQALVGHGEQLQGRGINDEQFKLELAAVCPENDDAQSWFDDEPNLYCAECAARVMRYDNNERQEMLMEIWDRKLEPELTVEEISKIQYEMAFDFLKPYLTLFFDVGFATTELFEDIDYLSLIGAKFFLKDEVPETVGLIHTPRGVFYDMAGNQITDVPFLAEEGMRAVEFSLYDLDGSGIPQIVIRYAAFDSCAMGSTVYSFREDEYNVFYYLMFNSRFFRDLQGSLFQIEFDGWGPFYKLQTVVFDGNEIRTEELCDDCIPDPNTLVRVRSLTVLEEKIANIVTGS